MTINGANFIGYSTHAGGKESFRAFSPLQNGHLPENFRYATSEEFEQAMALAHAAFENFRTVPAARRAAFLKRIAEEIMSAGDTLLERCSLETGLPVARLTGERARTCGQLNMFADLLISGWWVDARIDTAMPDRTPLPKPDIRRMLIPIGPVAVFGSSNFPLAFSTAGGDTASAFAAGCPVVVKAHSSHAGTNEIVSAAIIRAAKATDMPEGVFSSLYLTHEKALDLARHPVIKAVGFTGSRKVGMMLFEVAAQREEPIPVYAEMSAINPVLILEEALQEKSEQIAKGLADSITLGVGQFCTNPGVTLLKQSEASEKFIEQLSSYIGAAAPGTMLNRNICKSYSEAVKAMQKEDGVRVIAQANASAAEAKNEAQPIAFAVDAQQFLLNKNLGAEIFGPASMMVTYSDEDELLKVIESMEGQLTATIHAGNKGISEKVVNALTMKAGRIVYGGFPTGVEVCHSMQHGGPFPSTTDARSTSVGTAAIYRFVRPVAFQNFPDKLLPEALQNNNPLNILRLINGEWTTHSL